MMSISVGGLGFMSLRSRFAESVLFSFGRAQIKSIFCAFIVFTIILVLAYLTNPSENSFRAYLTEQSFRQHLSRLDDNIEEDSSSSSVDLSKREQIPLGTIVNRNTPLSNTGLPPFHFANRASISLRTPKHVFHSFGIFTIAAMMPLVKADGTTSFRDGSMVSDLWYIGAFGRWWRGGVIEAWYQDVISRSKDEESWSSGVLGMKSLDKIAECSGLPGAPKTMLARGSPPKLRNRERPSQKQNGLPSRSCTPPPLPKSASLPLHTTRPPHSSADLRPLVTTNAAPSILNTPSLVPPPPDSNRLSIPPLQSRTSSAIFEESPLITEVLRQISQTTSTVHDLREQLTEFETTSSLSHSALQTEVEALRERKRQDDSSRLELKSRTKTLEDSKRHSEGVKRDSEKRLKATEGARDDLARRMEHLDRDVNSLKRQVVVDDAAVLKEQENIAKAEIEINRALEEKKQEIKIAEEVVTQLNARARELEEILVNEKLNLQRAVEQADLRKQDISFNPLHHQVNGVNVDDSNHWLPSLNGNGNSHHFPSLDGDLVVQPGMPNSSPRPLKLSLGGLSNFNPRSTDSSANKHFALRSKGYSIFDKDIASLPQSQGSGGFSPFGDLPQPVHVRTPIAPSLVPPGLSTPSSLNGDGEYLSRSFQSESDVIMEREWRNMRIAHMQNSPIEVSTGPGFPPTGIDNDDHDPFEVRIAPLDLQRINSDPSRNHMEGLMPVDKTPRRWFSASSKEKPKKGLNPDAKVFSLANLNRNGNAVHKAATLPSMALSPVFPPPSYDALNPNGLGSKVMSTTSGSFLRAFAPSPAEREALQRALGGSSNGSLERLPSLSEVGNIPSSPDHKPALVANGTSKALPSWLQSLQSLPRIRKPNFSPWDDEDPLLAASTKVG